MGRTITSKSTIRPSSSKRIMSMPFSSRSPTRALNSSTTLRPSALANWR